MDASKVEAFLAANSKNLPADKIQIVKEKLEAADDSRYATISAINLKSPIVMFVISWFFGGLGVDRFMMHQTGMGLLKLFTAGCCGILWLIDVIKIMGKTKEANFDELTKAL